MQLDSGCCFAKALVMLAGNSATGGFGFARTGVETENAFVNDRLFDNEIGQVKHPVGDDRAGIAEADRILLFENQTRGRE